MAAKKKAKKRKPTKSMSTKAKSKTTAKANLKLKKNLKKKTAVKSKAPKKVTPKKAVIKKTVAKKASGRKKTGTKEKPVNKTTRSDRRTITERLTEFEPESQSARSGGQSGSLQGLSDVEGADSESVEELLEEGNSFEADVVAGVEEAGDADESEVHTHEVPEDDVPAEYLDKDE